MAVIPMVICAWYVRMDMYGEDVSDMGVLCHLQYIKTREIIIITNLPDQYLRTVVSHKEKRFLVSSVNLKNWLGTTEEKSETMASEIGGRWESYTVTSTKNCPEEHFKLVRSILMHGDGERLEDE